LDYSYYHDHVNDMKGVGGRGIEITSIDGGEGKRGWEIFKKISNAINGTSVG
jgi:hypothetical protein